MEERQDPLTLLKLWVWGLSPHLPPSFGQRLGSLHPSALGLKSVPPTPIHPSIEPANGNILPSLPQLSRLLQLPCFPSPLPLWLGLTCLRGRLKLDVLALCWWWDTHQQRGVTRVPPSFTSFPTSPSWNLPPELPQGQTPGMEISSRPQQD